MEVRMYVKMNRKTHKASRATGETYSDCLKIIRTRVLEACVAESKDLMCSPAVV